MTDDFDVEAMKALQGSGQSGSGFEALNTAFRQKFGRDLTVTGLGNVPRTDRRYNPYHKRPGQVDVRTKDLSPEQRRWVALFGPQHGFRVKDFSNLKGPARTKTGVRLSGPHFHLEPQRSARVSRPRTPAIDDFDQQALALLNAPSLPAIEPVSPTPADIPLTPLMPPGAPKKDIGTAALISTLAPEIETAPIPPVTSEHLPIIEGDVSSQLGDLRPEAIGAPQMGGAQNAVTINLGDFVDAGEVPQVPEVARRIWQSLGLSDEAAAYYAKLKGSDSPVPVFYGGTDQPEAAMRSVVGRASQTPGGFVSIPGMSAGVIEKIRQFGENWKKNEEQFAADLSQRLHIERLAGLDPERKQKAIEEISAKRPLTPEEAQALGHDPGIVRQVATDLLSGATGALGRTVEGAGQDPSMLGLAGFLVPESAAQQTAEAGKKIAEEAQRWSNKSGAQGIQGDITRGVGSSIPTVAASVLAPGTVLPRLAPAVMGWLQNSAEVHDEAIKAGASEEDAKLAAMLAGPVGLTEMFGVGGTASRAGRAAFIKGFIAKVLREAGEEGSQEAVQGTLNNLIAKGMYDPERAVFQNVDYNALIGMISGTAAGSVTHGATELSQKGKSDAQIRKEQLSASERTSGQGQANNRQVLGEDGRAVQQYGPPEGRQERTVGDATQERQEQASRLGEYPGVDTQRATAEAGRGDSARLSPPVQQQEERQIDDRQAAVPGPVRGDEATRIAGQAETTEQAPAEELQPPAEQPQEKGLAVYRPPSRVAQLAAETKRAGQTPRRETGPAFEAAEQGTEQPAPPQSVWKPKRRTLGVTERGAELIRRAAIASNPTGAKPARITGVMLKPTDVWPIVKGLRAQNNPESEALAQHLVTAMIESPTKGMFISQTGRTISEQKATLRHERAHGLQRRIDLTAMHAIPAYEKARAALVNRGYKNEPGQISREMTADLIAGQFERLNLTRDEARDILHTYFTTVGNTYGRQSIGEFQTHPAFRDIRDAIAGRAATQVGESLRGQPGEPGSVPGGVRETVPEFQIGAPKQIDVSTPRLKLLREARNAKPNPVRTVLDRLSDMSTSAVRRFYDQFVDIRRATTEARKRGANIPTEKDPGVILDLVYGGTGGPIEAMMLDYKDVMKEARGQGLQDALGNWLDLKGMERGLRVLQEKEQSARQSGNIKLADDYLRRINAGEVMPVGYTPQRITADLQAVERALGPQARDVKQMADRVWDLNRQAWDLAHNEGIISDTVYQQGLARGKEYIPLERVMDIADESKQAIQSSLSLRQQKILKRLEGSKRATRDPFIASIERHAETIREAGRNEAAKAVANLANLDPQGWGQVVKPLPAGAKVPTDAGTIAYYENGQKKTITVPKEWASALSLANAHELGLAGNALMRMTANMFRTGATLANLGFSIPNVLRDMQDFSVLSEVRPKNPVDFTRMMGQWANSLKQSIKQDDTYRDFLRSRAAFSTLQKAIDPEAFLDMPGSRGLASKLNVPGRVIDGIKQLNNYLEEATKLTAYKRAKQQGASDVAAAAETRRYGGSPDFARRGTDSTELNLLLMFANAQLQGIGRTFARVKEDPKRMIAPLVGHTAAALALYSWNHQFINPDDKKPEWDHIAANEKQNYFIIIRPDTYQTAEGTIRHRYLKIPKGHVAKLVYNPIESAIDSAAGGATDLVQSGLDLISNVIPGSTQLKKDDLVGSAARGVGASLNPIVREPVEQLANKDFFRNAPIIPRRLEDLQATAQTTATTSPTADKIGQATGVSPLRVEHAIRGFGAGLGEQALAIGDIGKRKGQDILTGDEEASKIPVIGPVVRRFVGGGGDEVRRKAEEKFYTEYDKADEASKTFSRLAQDDPKKAADFAAKPKNAEAYAKAAAFQETVKALASLRDDQTEIRQNDKLTPDQKREKIRKLSEKRRELLASPSTPLADHNIQVRRELLRALTIMVQKKGYERLSRDERSKAREALTRYFADAKAEDRSDLPSAKVVLKTLSGGVAGEITAILAGGNP